MFCYGDKSCADATIKAVSNITAIGDNALSGASIISDNNQVTVLINSTNQDDLFTLNCLSTDICYIICLSTDIYITINLNCSNDNNNCHIKNCKQNRTNSPTNVPTTVPTRLPTYTNQTTTAPTSPIATPTSTPTTTSTKIDTSTTEATYIIAGGASSNTGSLGETVTGWNDSAIYLIIGIAGISIIITVLAMICQNQGQKDRAKSVTDLKELQDIEDIEDIPSAPGHGVGVGVEQSSTLSSYGQSQVIAAGLNSSSNFKSGSLLGNISENYNNGVNVDDDDDESDNGDDGIYKPASPSYFVFIRGGIIIYDIFNDVAYLLYLLFISTKLHEIPIIFPIVLCAAYVLSFCVNFVIIRRLFKQELVPQKNKHDTLIEREKRRKNKKMRKWFDTFSYHPMFAVIRILSAFNIGFIALLISHTFNHQTKLFKAPFCNKSVRNLKKHIFYSVLFQTIPQIIVQGWVFYLIANKNDTDNEFDIIVFGAICLSAFELVQASITFLLFGDVAQ